MSHTHVDQDHVSHEAVADVTDDDVEGFPDCVAGVTHLSTW